MVAIAVDYSCFLSFLYKFHDSLSILHGITSSPASFGWREGWVGRSLPLCCPFVSISSRILATRTVVFLLVLFCTPLYIIGNSRCWFDTLLVSFSSTFSFSTCFFCSFPFLLLLLLLLFLLLLLPPYSSLPVAFINTPLINHIFLLIYCYLSPSYPFSPPLSSFIYHRHFFHPLLPLSSFLDLHLLPLSLSSFINYKYIIFHPFFRLSFRRLFNRRRLSRLNCRCLDRRRLNRVRRVLTGVSSWNWCVVVVAVHSTIPLIAMVLALPCYVPFWATPHMEEKQRGENGRN